MDENMNNVNNGTTQNTNPETTNGQAAPQQPAQPQQVATVLAQQPAVTEQQPGWFKRNWKKIVGTTAAVGTVIASAAVAFGKGKKAGIAEGLTMQQDDGAISPLDPNV